MVILALLVISWVQPRRVKDVLVPWWLGKECLKNLGFIELWS